MEWKRPEPKYVQIHFDAQEMIRRMVKDNPVSDYCYGSCRDAIFRFFRAEQNLWEMFDEQVERFDEGGTLEARHRQAVNIASVAKDIRVGYGGGVTEYTPHTLHLPCSSKYSNSVMKVYTSLFKKIEGRMGEDDDDYEEFMASKQLKEFESELENFESTRLIPTKWITGYKAWKCFTEVKGSPQSFYFPEKIKYPTSYPAFRWNSFIDSLKEIHDNNIDPGIEFNCAKMFLCDTLISTISLYKNRVEPDKQSPTKFCLVLEKVAQFSMKEMHTQEAWFKFVDANDDLQFIRNIPKGDGYLYGNLGLVTFDRLLECAGFVYETCHYSHLFKGAQYTKTKLKIIENSHGKTKGLLRSTFNVIFRNFYLIFCGLMEWKIQKRSNTFAHNTFDTHTTHTIRATHLIKI